MRRPNFVGQSVKLFEAPKFLTGNAGFIDDIQFPRSLYVGFVKSPYAHAKILKIDYEPAIAEGAKAVLTGEQVKQQTRPFWSGMADTKAPQYCMAVDKVLYCGEIVAAVVAESRYEAEDLTQLVEVEYEPLSATTDCEKALEAGSPLLHSEDGSNLARRKVFRYGNPEAAFEKAHLVVEDKFEFGRSVASPLETFGCIAIYSPADESYRVWANLQGFNFNSNYANCLKIPSAKLRMETPYQGGAFGAKFYSKYIVPVCLLAKTTGRPVKFIETRTENHLTGDNHGPESVIYASLAVDRSGYFRGLKMRHYYDIGAYMTGAVWQAIKALVILNGPYKFSNALYDVSIVFTNKTPQMAYRGFGIQATNFALERLVDIAAQKLGLSSERIRRINFIRPSEFPYETMTGSIYDSGDYAHVLSKALDLADYQGFKKKQQAERAIGRYLGIGISTCLEPGMVNQVFFNLISGSDADFPTVESVRLKVDGEGRTTVTLGFVSSGQGHDTIVRQMVADGLHVPIEDIDVVHADSSTAPLLTGMHAASRSAGMLAGALDDGIKKIKSKMINVAAWMMKESPEAIKFENGRFRSSRNRSVSFKEVAFAANTPLGKLPKNLATSLEETGVYQVPTAVGGPPDLETGRGRGHTTFGLSTHVAAVKVDIETGKTEVLNYTIVGDCGTQINPAIVEGQHIGGTIQGIGNALYEEFRYDDDGQPLRSTYVDYLIPNTESIPQFRIGSLVTPSPFTVLGVKGVGEGSTATAPPAIANAIEDALRPFGVRITRVPITPEGLLLNLKKTRVPAKRDRKP
jgi:CO/xanthine dehydrogenase Mo-binding subunit